MEPRTAQDWVEAGNRLAQGSTVDLAAARNAMALGRWKQAQELLQAFTETAERAEAWHLLLTVAHWLEDAALLERAMGELRSTALGADHPWIRDIDRALAHDALESGDVARARHLADGLLADTTASPLLRSSWHHVAAVVARHSGEIAESLTQLDRAIALIEAAHGPDDPRLLFLLAERAELRIARDDPGGLADLQTGRALAARLAPHHCQAIPLLFVELARLRARGEDARSVLEQALSLGTVALGPEHPTVSWIKVWLVGERLHQADVSGAIALATSELEVPGLLPVVRLELLRTRAAALLRTGDRRASRADLIDAERLAETGPLDDQLPKVLGELAIVTFVDGDRQGAYVHLRRRLHLLEERHGPSAPPTIGTRNAILHLLAGAPDPGMVARSLDNDSRPTDRRKRWAVSGWSALLFLAGFVLIVGWRDAVALLLVVFVHEAGHFLAMRSFGYRDPHIYFVPFLGAVTTGSVPIEEQTEIRRAIVALAGPLPSLVAALVLGFVLPVFPFEAPSLSLGQRTWLYVVGLNYLNLLPLSPLDGGKIVDTLVLWRWPWARVSFALASAAIVVVLAVHTDNGTMVVFGLLLSIAALLGLGGLRLDTLLRGALSKLHADDRLRPTAQVGVLFEVLHPLERRKDLQYLRHFRALTHALGESVLAPADPGSRWALLSAYGAGLFLVPPLLALASWLAAR